VRIGLVTVRLLTAQELVSLSEGSTVDLRKPGVEMDNLSELAEESMEPEECFPERENRGFCVVTCNHVKR